MKTQSKKLYIEETQPQVTRNMVTRNSHLLFLVAIEETKDSNLLYLTKTAFKRTSNVIFSMNIADLDES